MKGFVSFVESLVEGGVCLYQASISGNLTCEGSQFLNKSGCALLATGSSIGGAVFLDRNFVAEGSVNLEFTTIGGDLLCENGKFLNAAAVIKRDTQNHALTLERSNVGGSISLTNGFLALGKVNMLGVVARAHIDCHHGSFFNPGGHAILGNNACVSNGILLRNGFYALGEVSLFAANIGGNLECSYSRFRNYSQIALNAERAKIAGHLLLNNGFHSRGVVRLYATTVGGNLESRGDSDPAFFLNRSGEAITLEAADIAGDLQFGPNVTAEGKLKLIRLKVRGTFRMADIISPEEITNLDIRFAEITIIELLRNSWPISGRLNLDGLTYKTLGSNFLSTTEQLRAPA